MSRANRVLLLLAGERSAIGTNFGFARMLARLESLIYEWTTKTPGAQERVRHGVTALNRVHSEISVPFHCRPRPHGLPKGFGLFGVCVVWHTSKIGKDLRENAKASERSCSVAWLCTDICCVCSEWVCVSWTSWMCEEGLKNNVCV